MFANKEQKQKARGSAAAPKRRSPLDSRREQNMGIVLKALKMSPEEVESPVASVASRRSARAALVLFRP